MTVAKAEILEHIRQTGERITLPRQAVIEALCELEGHQTTQNVQQYLAGKGTVLQEATIYRVLQWLKNLAVVSQTDWGQSGIVYELLSAPLHHHLICLRCGHVQDFDNAAVESLRQHLWDYYDFEPRIDHLAIFGVCKDCRSVAEIDLER